MSDSNVPTTIADFFWYIILGLMTFIGTLLGIGSGLFSKRIDKLENNQRKVLKVIPQEALDDGLPLVMCKECATMRNNCKNLVTIDGLKEEIKTIRNSDLRAIKIAVHSMVFHSTTIPAEERETILKNLL